MSPYFSFAVFWFLASIPLGPNAVNSIRYGSIMPGCGWLWAPVGTAAAAVTFCAIVIMGFGIFVTERPILQNGIRFLGGCYLAYLGLEILISSVRRKWKQLSLTAARSELRNPFIDGYIISITNPKPIILYSSVLSGYLDVGSALSKHNAAILSITIGVTFFVYVVYGFLGWISSSLFSHRAIFQYIQVLSGISFIVLSGMIMYELVLHAAPVAG
jgi:threonine/homoserine/homoserine lactone efflux protein